jgi:hypothetical protein
MFEKLSYVRLKHLAVLCIFFFSETIIYIFDFHPYCFYAHISFSFLFINRTHLRDINQRRQSPFFARITVHFVVNIAVHSS